jgi:hypothetical protein
MAAQELGHHLLHLDSVGFLEKLDQALAHLREVTVHIRIEEFEQSWYLFGLKLQVNSRGWSFHIDEFMEWVVVL